MENPSKRQRGFISFAAGLALLTLYGAVGAGIIAVHDEEAEHRLAENTPGVVGPNPARPD